MSAPSFVPGQRWVSNTESELGLGIVVEVANRRVEISFPAAAEHRTYAMDNAPVSRVSYEIGQQVSSEDDQQITINQVLDNNGCLIYSGSDEQGNEIVLAELDLNSFVQFSKPQDRLFSGQIDKNRAFALRCETLEHIRHQQQSPVRGLLGARVQLLPHQLYIASETASRHAPRVLLADEVGLGKTIEAGLILHQQLISGRSRRVLVVVPDSLLHQWLVEMLRRFNLFFTILDEERCQGLEELGDESGDPFFDDPFFDDPSLDTPSPDNRGKQNNEIHNPFESAQLVLCTLSFLSNSPRRHAQAVAANWDLLIVDEAHHLQWSETSASPAYSAIEALAREARGLLLLTATPEQLGVESHFARLRLLDPDRYYDLKTFIDEEKNHQPVNQLVQQLLAEDAFSCLQQQPELLAQLRAYLGEPSVVALAELLAAEPGEACADGFSDNTFPDIIAGIIHNLLDRHGTGRVLFRNTRSSVAGFPDRQLQQYPLEAPARYRDALPGATIEQCLTPELLLGDFWIAEDPRVEWLASWLKQHRSDKVLVICARAATAMALEEHLRLRAGLSSAVFHEGLSLVARDRAAAYFADDEEGAQLLICSEIGSEGRNFQFSHHLVLFDLPLNPDLLEQRIGRLDRIGQRHTVNIHTPFYQNSAQHVLLRWYHEGINAFERTCPAGLALYEQFAQELQHQLQHQPQHGLVYSDNHNDNADADRDRHDVGTADRDRHDDRHDELHRDRHDELEQLISNTQTQTAITLEALQQGRDRLLELNSCNHTRADIIVGNMVEEERRQELSSYMEQVFDLFGVDQEHHSAASVVLRPSDHMVNHSFPGLNEDGITATFSREVALSREDIQFLSWEHPMVTGAMDMVLSGELGNTAFCTLKLPPLKAGTVLLEAIFIVHCSAPGELQLHRYLPLTTVRIVVDSNNTDLSKVLTPAHLDRLGQKVPRRSAQDLVNHARAQISTMLERAESLANAQVDDIIEQAAGRMQTEQIAELQRLQALAEVNANIRSEEIEYLKQANVSLQRYLQGAQLKLDAIRVALVTD